MSWKPRENEGKREEKRREEKRPPCWETVFYGVTATSGEAGCGIGHRRLPAIWRGQRCSRQNSTQNGHCAAVFSCQRGNKFLRLEVCNVCQIDFLTHIRRKPAKNIFEYIGQASNTYNSFQTNKIQPCKWTQDRNTHLGAISAKFQKSNLICVGHLGHLPSGVAPAHLLPDNSILPAVQFNIHVYL